MIAGMLESGGCWKRAVVRGRLGTWSRLAMALLLLGPAAAPAQKLSVETFSVGDGLPSPTIYDLD